MKTKRFCKSTVSLILALIMLVSMCSVALTSVSAAVTDVAETGATISGGTKLYIKTISNWEDASAKTAAYFFNSSGSAWSSFATLVDSSQKIYEVTVPNGSWTEMIWVRCDPAMTSPDWSWNQTDNQTYDGTNNLFVIDSQRANSNRFDGHWEAYNGGGSGDSGGGSEDIYFTEGENIYLQPATNFWEQADAWFVAHFFNSTTNTSVDVTGAACNDSDTTGKYYYFEVPSGSWNRVIFLRMAPSATTVGWDSNAGMWNRTGTLWATTDNCFQINSWNGAQENNDYSNGAWKNHPCTGTGGGTTDPTSLTKLYFMDNSSDKFMDDFDADMYASFDGAKKQQMKQRVDTISGKTLWSIDVPDDTTSVNVKRYSKLGTEWGSWNIPLSGITSGYYKAVSGSGSWESDESTFSPSSDEDIKNFWYGVWVDTKGEGNAHDAVRWWKDASGDYHIFLPSHTPSPFKLYTSLNTFTINNQTVTRGNCITMSNIKFDTKYSFSGTSNGSLYFHKTVNPTDVDYGVSTLLFTTDDQFWTETTDDYLGDVSGYKDAIETKGSIYLYDEDGNLVNNGSGETKLKKIKGRGNSSFKASMDIYGKYAYNFNLDKKVSLIDGATATKKWCLLANNVDHAMLRNTFAYNVAADLGLHFSPKTLPVDVYNNGEYIGSYTITEKVEYGKNTLMDGKDVLLHRIENLDDKNAEANSVMHPTDEEADPLYEFDTDDLNSGTTDTKDFNGTNYTYKYYTTYDRPAYENESGVEQPEATGLEFETPADYKECNYLLEFELQTRYQDEASWFVSSRTKQAVVVKYPEYATQAEMKWIISEYEAMESAVYADNYDGYKDLIDVDSFAKVYLIQELALNLDSCATSYYIHNEFTNDDKSKSKLVAGPVWDYDWSFGSYGGSEEWCRKPVYRNGNSNVNDKSMADPNQMFVKDKAIKTDYNQTEPYANNYNLQAKLAHNTQFWDRCKYIWTNDMVGILDKYIVNKYYKPDGTNTDTKGIMIETWLPALESSLAMNKVRWSNSTGSDTWGTKRTNDYVPGSHTFVPGDRETSGGNSTHSYANSVHYLNDWIAERWNFMSSSDSDKGNLYDESLLDEYKLNSVTLNATQAGASVSISVEFDALYKTQQVDDTYKYYELFVNGESQGDYNITETPTVTLEPNVETEIYVLAYLRDDKANYNMESVVRTFTYVVTGEKYTVEGVKFTYAQSEDGSKIKVTPTASVKCGEETVSLNDCKYTVIINGAEVAKDVDFETYPSVEVDLSLGENSVLVKVYPDGDPTAIGTSATEKVTYTKPLAENVEVTIKFKSSSSIRYLPSISINGSTAVPMTKLDTVISYNETYTQTFHWFTYTTTVSTKERLSIKFSNSYKLNASYTYEPLSFDEGEHYFGVNNLNDGTVAVNLDKYNNGTIEGLTVLNFVKSAANMLDNDPTAAGLGTTYINNEIVPVGDADGDGEITVVDATVMQMALAEKIVLDDTSSALSDYNLDGNKSITDATMVQTYLVH